ncbi:MAG: hypothetical protein WAX07_04980 [Candidatus Altiarchaeia archaeon]
MKEKTLLFILLAALAGAAYSDSMLSISLDVYKNGSVVDNGIKIKNNIATGTVFPGDYLLRITDEKNRSVWEKNITIVYAVHSDPPIAIDHVLFEIIVPYGPQMRHFALYKKEKLLFAGVIDVCNNDSQCDVLREDYLSCPGDCPIDKPEGTCLAYADGMCDPDCLRGIDPDCNMSQALEGLQKGINDSAPTNQAGYNPAEENKMENPQPQNGPATEENTGGSITHFLPYVAAIFLVIAGLLYVSGRKGIKRPKPSMDSSDDS